MDRRAFLVATAGGLLAAPFAAEAQSGKVYRIGFLGGYPNQQSHLTAAFRQGLRELGWIEGQNIVIEYRWAEGKSERIQELVEDLIRLKVDLIVAPTSTQAGAAKRATATVPIVFVVHGDPVGTGHVRSLSHPGGNLTGLSQMQPDLGVKELEFLREAVPGLSRIAVLWEPAIPYHGAEIKALRTASEGMGLRVDTVALRNVGDIETAFSTVRQNRPGGLLVLSGSLVFFERQHLAALTLKYRLPAIFTQREHAEAGGLMSYGPNLADLFRRAAVFVDRILKGAKPGNLPVEQPTKFELVINMKTAKALGLTIPQSLLLRADEIIQ